MSTVLVLSQVIAMNQSHGDHGAEFTGKGHAVAVALTSHDIGTPHTTLTKGCACNLYSFVRIRSFSPSSFIFLHVEVPFPTPTHSVIFLLFLFLHDHPILSRTIR